MSNRITDDEARQSKDAYDKYGTLRKAADFLGINNSTVMRRIRAGSERGLFGFDPVLPGFAIKETSVEQDPNGAVRKRWIRQGPEPGEEFEMPPGHVLKGISTLVNPEGRQLASWIKTKEGPENPQLIIDAIKSAFDEYKGVALLPPPPSVTDDLLLTVYNIADHHNGMYAWAQETGDDYDLDIASNLLRNTMGRLVASAPESRIGIILNLGDYFHTDNSRNQTEKSGHALDVDTRYAKVFSAGVTLMMACIDFALQKHDTVIVRNLPGNHDNHSALAMTVALHARYNGHSRVHIDTDPSRFFKYKFGRVLLTGTHGDVVKPEDVPGIVASNFAEDWGKTAHRYCYMGHVHHKNKGGGERYGLIWETFQTLAGKDAFGASRGFSSGRSMAAITHHRDDGEIYRNTAQAKIPIKGHLS